MYITRKVEKEVLTICVEGAVDSYTSEELKNYLLKLVSEEHIFFVIDFSKVTHITSAGLSSLVVAAKMVTLRRGHIAICGLNDLVKKVFAIVQFENFIKIFETPEEAMANVSAAHGFRPYGSGKA